jgi:Flp pilus assembly protein TadD
MLISSSRLLALFLVALLAACQSVPQPASEIAPATAAGPAVEIEPLSVPEPVDPDQQLYQQALQALKNGDTEIALEALTQLSESAPDKPYLFTNLGLAHFKLEQVEAAELAFMEAITRDANDAVAHNHLGILQRRKGQFQQALQQYQRALEIDANYATAHLNLGILFDLYLQDLNMALRHYQTYRSLSSGDDTQVDGWIVDIERRLKTAAS